MSEETQTEDYQLTDAQLEQIRKMSGVDQDMPMEQSILDVADQQPTRVYTKG